MQKGHQLRAKEPGLHLGLVIWTNPEGYANVILVLFALELLLKAFSLIPGKGIKKILMMQFIQRQKAKSQVNTNIQRNEETQGDNNDTRQT